MTMPKPTVRSMRPAIIGNVAASDKQRDDRLVGEDRARVERGRESVGQEQREEDDQQDRQDRQAIDRRHAPDRLPARQRRKFRPRRLERVGFNGLHERPGPGRGKRRRPLPPSVRCWRRLRRADFRPTDRRRQVRRRPGRDSNTNARWHTLATSSKSVDTIRIAAPACEGDVEQPVDLRLGADVDAGRRILEDIDLARRGAASARPPPSAGCRLTGARSAASDRLASSPLADQAPMRRGFRGAARARKTG